MTSTLKERKEMNRFEIVEKMFKKFNVVIDGKEIWKLIEDDVNSTGKMDGVHSIELGKLGNDRDLYFPFDEYPYPYAQNNDELEQLILNFNEEDYLKTFKPVQS